MKKVFLLGALLLGLTACGGGGGGTVTPTPDASYPYNPSASMTPSSDARVPYRGDWVFVANLDDGSKRYGVVSVTDKYSDDNFKNAGGGFVAWCVKSDCQQDDEQGTGLIGSATIGGKVELTVGMVPENSTAVRFLMADDDGVVGAGTSGATISGQGSWMVGTSEEHAAVFAFVQINTKSQLATQQVKARAFAAAQGVLLNRGGPQKAAPTGELRATLERALAK